MTAGDDCYDPQRLPPRLAAYEAYLRAWPERFESPPGGVEIVTDLAGISRIEAAVGDSYERRALPRAWAEVGLLYEDPYLLLIRDAVRFPDGSPGVHHRVLRRSSDPSGVAVMPLLGDRIVLVRHFRHPTRDWQWELPRGAIDADEGPGDAARRELAEEISAEVLDVVSLGRMHGATGFMGMTVLLAVARIASVGEVAVGEGITEHRAVTVPELEQMVRAGEVTDSFTLGCFLHARLAGIV
jgi:ADP-ribose pyrophosphatase